MVEQPSDPLVAKWLQAIKIYENKSEKWYNRARKIVKRYKDEREARSEIRRFNVLWSNVETLKPALYAQSPKPDVQRRYRDQDDIGRMAAEVLERCLAYCCNMNAFGSVMRQVVLDYLLAGRGTSWARYVPHFRDKQIDGTPATMSEGAEISEDINVMGEAEAEPEQELYYEEVVPDYVHWEDFGHTEARTWEEVGAVWRKAYLSRKQLIDRFGDIGKQVPLDCSTDGKKNELDESLKRATVYEIWDKESLQVVWLHKEHPEPLDVRDDPLGLERFFPCPRPIYATLANDSLIPVPDYVEYQDQAEEMDTLTNRINAIIKAIKVAGVYDASAPGLARLLAEGVENQLIPVDQWAALSDKGGLAGSYSLLPIQEIAQTLLSLYEAREKIKSDLYEVTGIADIIRGETQPNETATAQRIKSNFVTMRLDEKQREVQRFARNLIEIMGQIIARKFEIATMAEISGVRLMSEADKQKAVQAQQVGQPLPDGVSDMLDEPTWEEVDQLLKNDSMRSFRIDIETNSTIAGDEQQEKQDRLEFLNAIGPFMAQGVEAVQQTPAIAPLVGQLLLFAVRAFPVGKTIEGEFETTIKKLEEMAQQPQPNPEQQKMQQDAQLQQQKQQSDAQAQQQKIAMDQQAQQQKMAADHQLAQMKMQMEAQQNAMEAKMDAQREQAKMMLEMHMEQMKAEMQGQIQLAIAHINAASKIEAARITAKADDGAAAYQAEASQE